MLDLYRRFRDQIRLELNHRDLTGREFDPLSKGVDSDQLRSDEQYYTQLIEELEK